MKSTHIWIEISISNHKGQQLFCRHYFTSIDAPNVLYIQTPLGSVGGFTKKAYEPLSKYGFNIFAVDLAGIGKSEGSVSEFTANGVLSDLDSCINYIEENFNGKVFLFGGTGIGGIWGQYYASYSNRLDGFAQFAVGIYEDLSPLGLSLWAAKTVYNMMKLLKKIAPNLCINMKPPEYYGKNKEQDDYFYEMSLLENPHMFKPNINWMTALMEIFLGKNSYLKDTPKCPVLVFQTLSDRYFPAEYFEHYYDRLTCHKKLYSIDDVHNSYYFRADEVCEQVAKWFLENTNEVTADA
ncbi:serine aminopeptidase domain-containing protein [Paramaledivibacter caminithermalis]|uniref:Lysophospholipase, alpha-beta hydrolase superfamily n=1 Tax=Paramaledivibacter caminithermalis (strain DSM 15212 / CIP 107654 / DViRD3) TaxID=1121301 RepID=A0A1M6SEU8_PARC5|nr:alpha/beta hydrolase [Paramaledivibacter caminithermalis]SHK43304.1 Lysophospholipase, alpha-beta hydrolase superfamily [Paramaledivibacter caminithermalis DSM 15212]